MSGVSNTLAGTTIFGYVDGVGTVVKFQFPREICLDSSGALYISDSTNGRIRKLIEGTNCLR